MQERPSTVRRATNGAATSDGAATSPVLRDADAILARAIEDETAALEARDRFRDGAMEPIEPDARIAERLVPDEVVFAVRRSAVLDRREPQPGGCVGSPGLAGDLYLTSMRLVHLGRLTLEYDLDAIREVAVSAEHLLLVLCDGAGLILDVDRPRLFRVEIAAVRAMRVARARPTRAERSGVRGG